MHYFQTYKKSQKSNFTCLWNSTSVTTLPNPQLSPRYQKPHAHCPHDLHGHNDHHLPHDHYLPHDHHRPHDHHHLKRAPTVTMVSEMELGWGRRG